VAERLWRRKAVDVSRPAVPRRFILWLNDAAVTAVAVQLRTGFWKRGHATLRR
jgi:hypothetical protein